MSKPKRFFIIDAMAMAFRNFHAFGVRPLMTSDGTPTSAVFGSSMFMLKLLEDENPDYIAVATDSREPTFRHKLYSEYKANRSAMPEDLVKQLPLFWKLFEAMDIPLIREPGLEADDLIGSLVKKYGDEGIDCFIVSGDKDFMQLINDHVSLYTPKKGGVVNIINYKGVEEKFGCRPDQVIDILALMGDSSDNVPGVPGIGEKGASKLIAEFGSIAGIYERIDEVKNKRQATSLANGRDMAELSRELVTIITDRQFDFTLDDFKYDTGSAIQSEDLLKLFQDLEFKGLVKRLEKDRLKLTQTSPAPSTDTTPSEEDRATTKPKENTNYQAINSDAELRSVISEFIGYDAFAFDTETTGLDCIDDKPIGVSLSAKACEGYYLPIPANDSGELSRSIVISELNRLLGSEKPLKIAHNLKYDMQMLLNIDIKIAAPMGDSMLSSYLLKPNIKGHGLDNLCEQEFGHTNISITELIGKDKKGSMTDVPLEQMVPYACEDADYTLRLHNSFCPRLKEANLGPVYEEIEIPLVPVLAKIEQTGIYVDAEILGEISDYLAEKSSKYQREIFEFAGKEFNINSTKQLQAVLFDELKIHEELGVTRLKKTKTGISTDSSVMERLSEHPLPRTILQFRTVSKLKNTYVDSLPQLINPKTGRIHTSFHQTGTATGRLSSSDPNLQNIPIRSEDGKQIRKAFKASSPNNLIVSADYSQIELRILAHLADESALIAAFERGDDIHTATASKIFKVAPDEVDGTLRSRAKAINFGIIYGMGPQRLARTTGVKVPEAKKFIELYFDGFPGVRDFIDSSKKVARELGYSTTLTGRRRPIPEFLSKDRMAQVNADNIAVNSPVQGSAADLIKIAMIRIDKRLTDLGLKSKMLLQVHDELVFEVPKSELDQVQKLVKETMEGAMQLKAPLLVEVGNGQNWLEAH